MRKTSRSTIQSLAPWLQAVALALLLVAWARFSTPVTSWNAGMDSDGRYYAAMAGAPGMDPQLAATAPFARRVLSPWIVAHLPGDDVVQKFRLLATFDSVLLLILVYAFLRRLGMSHGFGLVGQLLYAGIFWTVKFSFYSPCYIEDLTQVLIFLVLWTMLGRHWWLVPLEIAGAAFQRESIVYLAPVALTYFWSARGWRGRRLVGVAALLSGSVAVPLIVQRALVHTWNAGSYDLLQTLLSNFRGAVQTPSFEILLFHATFSGLGLLPLLVCLRPGAALRHLGTHRWWWPLLAAGVVLLFGGTDKARLFLYSAPAVLCLGLESARSMMAALPRRVGAIWLGVVIVSHFWLGNHLQRMPSFPEYLDRFVPIWGPKHGVPGVWRVLSAIAVVVVATMILRVVGARQPSG